MTYPPQVWRLLITPPSRGAWNMAVDEAVMEAVEADHALPTLRLYAWHPPCLSLGYAQPSSDVDLSQLTHLGWDWVRRLTGGRAILHTDELTYSVIAPLSDPRVSGGVLESYQRLSVALLAALHQLDIPALSEPGQHLEAHQRKGAVCFEIPSNYEIVIQGKKLIGSAQARRKHTLLQHGTFPLCGDLKRITQVLAFPDENLRLQAATRLLAHATTAEMVLLSRITFQTAAEAFIHGFQSELNLKLTQDELTQAETNRATQLEEQKYTSPAWLNRL